MSTNNIQNEIEINIPNKENTQFKANKSKMNIKSKFDSGQNRIRLDDEGMIKSKSLDASVAYTSSRSLSFKIYRYYNSEIYKVNLIISILIALFNIFSICEILFKDPIPFKEISKSSNQSQNQSNQTSQIDDSKNNNFYNKNLDLDILICRIFDMILLINMVSHLIIRVLYKKGQSFSKKLLFDVKILIDSILSLLWLYKIVLLYILNIFDDLENINTFNKVFLISFGVFLLARYIVVYSFFIKKRNEENVNNVS